MAVNAKVFGVGIGPVQHDVVGAEKLSSRHDLEAEAEDVSSVHGIGIRVADLEGGDWCGDAVDALLHVGLLLG